MPEPPYADLPPPSHVRTSACLCVRVSALSAWCGRRAGTPAGWLPRWCSMLTRGRSRGAVSSVVV